MEHESESRKTVTKDKTETETKTEPKTEKPKPKSNQTVFAVQASAVANEVDLMLCILNGKAELDSYSGSAWVSDSDSVSGSRERESRVDRKLSLLISFGLTSTSCCLSHLRSSCSCANYYLLILISLSSPFVIPSAMPQATDRRTLALALALTFISGASSLRQSGRVHFTSPRHTLNSTPLPSLHSLDCGQSTNRNVRQITLE